MLTFQVQWSKTRCSFVLFFFLFKNKKKHFKSCSTFFLSTVSSYLKMEYVASQVLFYSSRPYTEHLCSGCDSH